MTQDDDYQVIYECSICGKVACESDTNLARIERTFEDVGWENVPVSGAFFGKVDYIAFCPKCYEKEQNEADEHDAYMEELDDQEFYRQGA